jgi:uncharacterized protein YyaL (SSP411 family)
MKCSIYYFRFITIFFILSACTSDKKEKSEPSQTKNRLAQASSPYLIAHADNPVDWYEWGDEALQKAKDENKPIIISIGYAACHWCHVMEEESFMDSTVAAIMNKNFVSIKIDREERPDIDKIYMNAAQLLTGSGGWPLNAITLPDGKPFFAGTYFTKEEWKNILIQVSEKYRESKPELVETAEALTRGIRNTNTLDTILDENTGFPESDYISLLDTWKNQWDTYNGGYSSSQKFPLPTSWEAVLQYYYLTGNEAALEFVNTTLHKMARGGIYDQLGGGFARYTTDTKWRIPHFEKMLYDNAQLISLYSQAYKLTKKEEYKQVIEESIAFVERELSNGKGGYYSSINADSDGEEGKYYVWTSKEIKNNLNAAEAELFSNYYNVESYGNWEEGKNILYRNNSGKEFSEENNIPLPDFEERLNSASNKLLKVRRKRIKPTIDNKVLTSWNALMVQAYIDAFTALREPEYLERAIATANFLNEEMLGEEQELWRSYMDGEKKTKGFLDDYAFVVKAYINLYQITFDLKWLKKAEKLMDYTLLNFKDNEQLMFYYTSNSQSNLIARKTEISDNILPSSNSVMAYNLYVLGSFMENEQYLDLSEKMLLQISQKTMLNPSSYANWTKLLGLKAFGAYEVAIVGEEAFSKNKMMHAQYMPTALYMGGKTENLPLLKSKVVKGETLIYVCQNKTCRYPVSYVSEALDLLENYNQNAGASGLWNGI